MAFSSKSAPYLRTSMVRSLTAISMAGAFLLLCSMVMSASVELWPDSARTIAILSIASCVLALGSTVVFLLGELRCHWRHVRAR